MQILGKKSSKAIKAYLPRAARTAYFLTTTTILSTRAAILKLLRLSKAANSKSILTLLARGEDHLWFLSITPTIISRLLCPVTTPNLLSYSTTLICIHNITILHILLRVDRLAIRTWLRKHRISQLRRKLLIVLQSLY